MKRRFLVAVVLAATLVPGLLALHAGATTPGRNGWIAFTRYRLQNAPLWSEIFVARSDGSEMKKVSQSPIAVEDDQAQWSRDGKLIVFDRCTSSGPCSVWLVRPDGSGQRRLRPICRSNRPHEVCADDSGPSFAPDGKHIVFTHEWGRIKHFSLGDQIEHSTVATIDLQGRHLTILRRLAPYAGDLQAPRISPDGTLLVYDRYNSNRARPAGSDALFVTAAAGGAARQLTGWSLSAGSPDWSPDGERVMFKRFLPGNELTPGTNLYTIRIDGTGLRRVTDVGDGHYVLAGSFSPDGTSIVFATDLDAAPNPHGGRTFADIFTQRLGTNKRQAATRSANLDGWPSWGSAN